MQGNDDLGKNPEKLPSQQWQGFKFFCGNYDEELNQNSTVSNFLESDDIIPLSQARAGDILLIIELLTINCIEDLRDIGFLPGKEIHVISRTTTGSVIVLLPFGFDSCFMPGNPSTALPHKINV